MKRLILILIALVALAPSLALAQVTLLPGSFDFRRGGEIMDHVQLSDGSFLIGGRFTEIDGVPRSNLARLHADGTLDTEWSMPVNGDVRALDVRPDGSVYIGGDFSRVNGVPRFFLALLSPGPGAPVLDNWTASQFEAVSDLAALANGDLLINDGRVWRYPAGSSDPIAGFGSWEEFHSATFETSPDKHKVMLLDYYRVALFSDNGATIWIYDRPTDISSISTATLAPDGGAWIMTYDNTDGWAQRFRRLAPDGLPGTPVVTTVSGVVDHIALAPSGELWLTTSSRFGMSWDVIGIHERGTISRLDINGTPLPGTINVMGSSHRIMFVSDGALIGGRIRTTKGLLTPGLTRVDSTLSTIGTAPKVLRTGTSIQQATALPDGGFMIAGDFIRVNGQEQRFLMRLDGNLQMTNHQWSLDSVPTAVSLSAAGDCYVGGLTPLLATSNLPHLLRLNACATLDPAFDLGVPSPVTALLALPDRVLVGLQVESGADEGYAVRSYPTSSSAPLPSWSIGFDHAVSTMVAINGRIYIGGSFFRVNHVFRNGVVRLSASLDGAIDSTWTAGATPGRVLSMRAAPDGSLIVAGVPFNPPYDKTLLRLSPLDGSRDPLWTPFGDQDNGLSIRALAIQEDGSLATAWEGSSCCIEAMTSSGLFGASRRAFIGMVSGGTIADLQPLPGFRLLILGEFSSAFGQPRQSIAVFGNTQGPLLKDSFE
ncbi:hypothetical protein C7S18_19665 [Ahniella affigens]|uniref:Uncharacterized protein n=1 Tax=Ahniella affigens TaxID=2021234 RepID=A0A2P1PWS2_9GAMM|nr:delta-60 repeat domain-containing protein [Ahniella affigens]AVP99244.1 hypothetical protein C7S18_19665 [Ahniella affigens]